MALNVKSKEGLEKQPTHKVELLAKAEPEVREKLTEGVLEKTKLKVPTEVLASLLLAKRQLSPIAVKFKTLTKAYEEAESVFIAALEETGITRNEKRTLSTKDGLIEVSACKRVSLISDKGAMLLMLEEVKEGLSGELSKVGITDIKKYLTEAEVKEVITEEYTGKRAVKITTL